MSCRCCGAGVLGGLGALFADGGYTAHKYEETSAMNSAWFESRCETVKWED